MKTPDVLKYMYILWFHSAIKFRKIIWNMLQYMIVIFYWQELFCTRQPILLILMLYSLLIHLLSSWLMQWLSCVWYAIKQILCRYYACRIKTGSGEVCCHNARGRVRNRKSNPDGVAGGIWRTVRTSPSALWQQIGLNHNYNMTFLISPHGCPYSPLKWRSSRSKREPFCVLLPLLRHVAPLSDGKLLSHNGVVKGRCARDAIPWTFHIEVFKCGQDNSDTITRIGDDSVELLDSC